MILYATNLIADLTNTLQRQNDRPFVENEDSWRMADKRFVWNHFIANNLLQFADESSKPAVSAFLIQVIHGAVFINRCSINGVRDLILKDFQHDFNAIIFFAEKFCVVHCDKTIKTPDRNKVLCTWNRCSRKRCQLLRDRADC